MSLDVKEVAKQIVSTAFDGKKDKAGQPYSKHLYRVASTFEKNEGLYCAALLHDLLEDCPEWTAEALLCFFSKGIVDTITLLTKSKGEDYSEYIRKIGEDDWATRIKIQDLLDNMDIARLPELTEKDISRLKKYHNAYLQLL